MRRPEGAMGDDLRGLDELLGTTRGAAPGAARSVRPRRRAGRRPRGADGHRGDGAAGHRAAPGGSPAATSRCAGWRPGDGGADAAHGSTRCPRIPASASRPCRTTTSWSPPRASASSSSWTAFGTRCSTALMEGMADAIRNATPEQLEANRQMVRDLDSLLRRRLDGDEPTQGEVDDVPGRTTAPSSRVPRPSTTSWTSWRTGWPRCSR